MDYHNRYADRSCYRNGHWQLLQRYFRVELDLGVFVLTLGLTIKINIASIIGIIISFIIYRLLVR